MPSTMARRPSGPVPVSDASPSAERGNEPTNRYGNLPPKTIDDLFRLIKLSSPGLDISELPVIKEARLEWKIRTKGDGSSNDSPQTTYGFASTQPQLPSTAAFTEHNPSSVASNKENTVTVRIMVTPKDGSPSPSTSTHELFELNPNLSCIQLHDTLRRFLLKHSKGDIKSRANLAGCVFTPDHQLAKIKAVWSNVNAASVTGEAPWGTPAGVPSSDTYVTEDNCAILLAAMMKRAGALDALVLITHVPEE